MSVSSDRASASFLSARQLKGALLASACGALLAGAPALAKDGDGGWGSGAASAGPGSASLDGTGGVGGYGVGGLGGGMGGGAGVTGGKGGNGGNGGSAGSGGVAAGNTGIGGDGGRGGDAMTPFPLPAVRGGGGGGGGGGAHGYFTDNGAIPNFLPSARGGRGGDGGNDLNSGANLHGGGGGGGGFGGVILGLVGSNSVQHIDTSFTGGAGGHAGPGGSAGGGSGGSGLVLANFADGTNLTLQGALLGGNGGRGGGGNGGAGLVVGGGGVASITLNNSVVGGIGGEATTSSQMAGRGGDGVVIEKGGVSLEVNGLVRGGDGGSTGAVGDGGVGIRVGGVNSFPTRIFVNNTVAGGNASGIAKGGAAIAGENVYVTLGENAMLLGGMDGVTGTDWRDNGASVHFTGGANTLEIHMGASLDRIDGADRDDTLVLGGTFNGSFELSKLGDDRRYGSFGKVVKRGTNIWDVTGTTTHEAIWEIEQGTLSLIDPNALANAEAILLDGMLDVANHAGAVGANIRNLHSGNGALNLGPASLTLNQQIDGSFAGAIYGNGNLIKEGNGTLTLFGTNEFFGGKLEVLVGTLKLAGQGSIARAGSVVVDSTLDISDIDASETSIKSLSGGNTGKIVLGHKMLTVTQEMAGAYFGSITGTGIFEKAGFETLTLEGNLDNFTGTLSVNEGTLALAGTTSLASMSEVMVGAGTLDLSGSVNSQRIRQLSGNSNSGVIKIGGGRLTIDQMQNSIYAGTFDGTGRLTKSGLGLLALVSNNDHFTGDVLVQEGTLMIADHGSIAAAKAVTINGGTLDLASATSAQTIRNLNGKSSDAAILLGGTTLTVDVTQGSTSALRYSGKIESNATGGLVKTGANVLLLNGDLTNLKGNVTVDQGQLVLEQSTSIANAASVQVNEGVLDFRASTVANFLHNLSGDSFQGRVEIGEQYLQISQDVDATYAGVFKGNGTLEKTGEGELRLTGPNINHDGRLQVNGGTLSLVDHASFGAAKSVAVNRGTLDISATAAGAQFNDLSGRGREATVAIGAQNLTIVQRALLDYAGTFSGTGTISLQGSAAGGLKLSGDSSGFTGLFEVNGTTLQVGAPPEIIYGRVPRRDAVLGGDVVVRSGGTLSGQNGTIEGHVHVEDYAVLGGTNNGGTLTMGSLRLDENARTRVNLGAPNTMAVFNVRGDMTLNGSIDVTGEPGYGIGVYRIFESGGALTDKGIHLGRAPTGDFETRMDIGNTTLDIVVEKPDTSLQYWAANGTDRGGSGVWNGKTLWQNGKPGSMAEWGTQTGVFMGEAGTVTVEGAQKFGTLEFVTNGFALVAGEGGSLDLGEGGRLWAEGINTVATIGTSITGTGALTKIGAGTIVLTGDNSYEGGTIVSAGTLKVSSDRNLGAASGSVSLDAGMLLAGDSFETGRSIVLAGSMGGVGADKGATLTLGGTVSGDGVLVIAGEGTVALKGANTHSGGTMISGGTLSIGADAALGAASGKVALAGGTLQANASFTSNRDIGLASKQGLIDVTQGNTLTLSGVLSGDGTLVKGDLGTLILTGDNSFAGGTIIKAGTLQIGNGGNTGSILGNVVNEGTLIFDRAGSYTFPGDITGTGAVVIRGGGAVKFSGAKGYSGAISVVGSSMRLDPNSVSTSEFTVGTGGILSGTGKIGGLIVRTSGTAAPGYSPGTLEVDGNVLFETGSTYIVDVTPLGGHDLINATGTATLQGGTVQMVAEDGVYAPNTTRTILTAAQGVTGQFATVTSNLAFLTPTLSYGANEVRLTFARNDIAFATKAKTANQRAAAVAAQGLGMGNAAYDAILKLTDATAPAAFDALSGEVHATANTVLLDQSAMLRQAAGMRLGQTLSMLGDTGGMSEDAYSATAGAWGYGFGSWGDVDGNGNAGSVSHDVGGFIGGVDAAIGENGRAGVIGGWGRSTFRTRTASGEADSYHVGVYGGAAIGRIGVKAGVSHSWHDLSVNRSVAFPGIAAQQRAKYSAGTSQAFGEVAYGVQVADTKVEPFAGLAYVHLPAHMLAETGDTAALRGKVRSQEAFFSTLGLRAASTIALGKTSFVKPYASAAWQHGFGDLGATASLAFAGTAAPAFTVAATPIAKDSALLGGGLELGVSDKVSLSVGYTGTFGSTVRSNTARGALSIRF